MQQFAATRNPVAALGAINPTAPFIQDAALQAGGLIAPHTNRLSQAIAQSSENLGLGPLAIPEVTDQQLAPLLMLGMGSPTKMGFYSPSGKALTTAPGKGTSQQYLAHLKKEPGATKEGKQTGLIQRLEEAPGTLTKEEVVSMWNPIELTETVRGEVPWTDEELARWNYLKDVWHFERGDMDPALRAELQEFGEREDLEPKYGNEQKLNLPGGEEPKEILVQLYDAASQKRIEQIGSELETIFRSPEYRQSYLLPEHEADILGDRVHALKKERDDLQYGGRYKSTHWSEPNVLAHIRTNKRDVGGVRALHAEEFQSDWHQTGQKKGYGTSMSVDERNRLQTRQMAIEHLKDELGKNRDPQTNRMVEEGRWHELSSEHEQIEATLNNDSLSRGKVPDAPYKKDWHELAFKRFLMEGINDPSVDRITWTSGAVQADRYDLSKHLSEVHLSGSNFVAYDHDGNTVIKQTGVRDEDLPDLIGKEAAEKLLAQPKEGTLQSLTGLDLQLGGEFHKNLYDKKIPQFAKKFLKKYGVEPKRISDQESEMVFELTDDFETPDRTDEQVDLWMNDEFIHSYPNRKEAEKFLNEQENLWYIDITPEMRRDLQQKGVPLAMNPFLRSEKLSPFMA